MGSPDGRISLKSRTAWPQAAILISDPEPSQDRGQQDGAGPLYVVEVRLPGFRRVRFQIDAEGRCGSLEIIDGHRHMPTEVEEVRAWFVTETVCRKLGGRTVKEVAESGL